MASEEDKKPKPDEPRPALYAYVKEVIEKLLETHSDIKEKFIEECNKLNNLSSISTYVGDFSDPASRIAYVLVHSAQRMYLINSVLTDAYSACTNLQSRTTVFNELMHGVDWGAINVFSFGGGPACDVIGVLMWLHRFGLRPKVTASVTEKCGEWEGVAEVMMELLQQEKAKTAQHKYVNNLWRKLEGGSVRYFEGEPSAKSSAAIAQADIVLLPFVLGQLGADVSATLQTTLDTMKPGALLLYLEECESPHTELINNLSYWSGLRRIYFIKELAMTLPKYEDVSVLEEWGGAMDRAILRESKCTAIVYKKPSGYAYDRRVRMGRREQDAVKQTQIRLKKSNPNLRLFKP